jgi:hypothetical protein
MILVEETKVVQCEALSGGNTIRVDLHLRRHGEHCTLFAYIEDQVIAASPTRGNFFLCLVEARIRLEQAGVMLLVQGARPRVWPSGMMAQSTFGMSAYLHSDPKGHLAVIRTFEPASPAEVGSVWEQIEWRQSMGANVPWRQEPAIE